MRRLLKIFCLYTYAMTFSVIVKADTTGPPPEVIGCWAATNDPTYLVRMIIGPGSGTIFVRINGFNESFPLLVKEAPDFRIQFDYDIKDQEDNSSFTCEEERGLSQAVTALRCQWEGTEIERVFKPEQCPGLSRQHTCYP
jgi:hypothetical protein